LVLGAGGFIGANLLRTLLEMRDDVYGTVIGESCWRLQGVDNLIHLNNHKDIDGLALSKYSQWGTVFNCIAYGAYSWQSDTQRIYATNFDLTRRIVDDLAQSHIKAYIHAGSSSEYGLNSGGPSEDFSECKPDSHYAVSKLAATMCLKFMGTQGFPCAVLRLASVYGPWEDPKRLMPRIIEMGLHKKYPPLVHPDITRDFVHVSDVVEAFVDAALCVADGNIGHVFNIGSGEATSIGEVSEIAQKIFDIKDEPEFTMPKRDWDHGSEWYLDVDKARGYLGWEARVPLESGLKHMAELAVTK